MHLIGFALHFAVCLQISEGVIFALSEQPWRQTELENPLRIPLRNASKRDVAAFLTGLLRPASQLHCSSP